MKYVADLGCGTATSAALFFLLFFTDCFVLGIDRDKSEEWVRKHLPPEVQHRFVFVNDDVGSLTLERLDQHMRRAFGVGIDRLDRLHWSPSCESLSRAARGWHRGPFG